MKISMFDLDSKFGNLYLMQLSTLHKSKGDVVVLNDWSVDPDLVYISVLFMKNKPKALGLAKMFSCPVRIGGTGYNLKPGDPEIMNQKPDYDLYPSEEALGRTTLGCIYKCPWCVVPKKEGYFSTWMHVSEFYDERFDTVHLLDNNILAGPMWFFRNTGWIIDHDLWLREEGMDLRLLTPTIAKRLRELRIDGMLHFAWDRPQDEEKIIKGIRMLKDAGFDTRHEISIYILMNFNTTIEQDIYRFKTLRDLDVNPFAMVYGKGNPGIRKLARAVNRKQIFWSNSWLENPYDVRSMRD